MDNTTVDLVFPRAEVYRERPRSEGRSELTDLQGKVVAFVDDGRPNADVALASVRDEMVGTFHIRPVMVQHRALGLTPADPLPRDVFERLVVEVDAVVVGIAS